MAITAARVYNSVNRIRYLITATAGGGEAVTITTTGGATPDIVTDSLPGPIKNLANAHDNGYGKIAAGALTQAQARALWLGDDSVSVVGADIPVAAMRLTPRTTATSNFKVDANQAGGEATIVVTADGIGIGYLDIEVPGAIGLARLTPP